jgi:hypothetical protein
MLAADSPCDVTYFSAYFFFLYIFETDMFTISLLQKEQQRMLWYDLSQWYS